MAAQVNVTVFNENGDRQIGGFFPGIFCSGFDHKFLCYQCHKILRDPVQGACGHRLCRSCRDEIINTAGTVVVECPACLDEKVDQHEVGRLSINEMFPDNAVKREMSNMVSACVFPKCTWRGKFKEYEAHEGNCEFRQVACALCAQPVTNGRMEEHRQTECVQRHLPCDYCGADIVFARMESHHSTCEKFPMKCDLCNQQDILREQMKDHMEIHCSKRSISCPMGCTDQFQLDKFPEHLHLDIEPHLAWAVQKVMSMEQKMEDGVPSPTVLNQIKGEITNIDKKIHNLERQLKQLIQSRAPSEYSTSSSSEARAEGSTSNLNKAKSAQDTAKYCLKLVEPILIVLHGEVDKANRSLQVTEGLYRQQQAQLDELDNQFRMQQQSLQLKDAAISDLEMRLAAQEMARYDGTILWKVSGFEAKKKEAISGQTTSLYSPAFYSGPCGYKMCARIYPNGDGIGKGCHISLFFVIMRGHYDALLPWPFSQKVTLMMIDQNHKEHIVDAFKPDPSSTSFKRPTTEMNIASGCPLFLPLEKLHSKQHGYLRDNTLFVKIIVDTEGLDRFTEMNPGRFATGYQ